MFAYEYTTDKPNLDYVHKEVINSLMTNKSIQYCNWNEGNTFLTVYFETSLSAEDKVILDSIIAQSVSGTVRIPTEDILLSPTKDWKLKIDDTGVLTTEEVI